jgi:hypothetical protein
VTAVAAFLASMASARLMREAARDARLLAGLRAGAEAVCVLREAYAAAHACCLADARRARLAVRLPG